jgi:hypothetical protein
VQLAEHERQVMRHFHRSHFAQKGQVLGRTRSYTKFLYKIQLKGYFRANLAVPENLGNGKNVLETVGPGLGTGRELTTHFGL